MQIAYPDFIAYIRREQGRTAATIGGHGSFTWEVLDHTLQFTLPDGKKRNESLSWVEAFCDRFNDRKSFTTSDYPEERNSSYLLGLARDYLNAKGG